MYNKDVAFAQSNIPLLSYLPLLNIPATPTIVPATDKTAAIPAKNISACGPNTINPNAKAAAPNVSKLRPTPATHPNPG